MSVRIRSAFYAAGFVRLIQKEKEQLMSERSVELSERLALLIEREWMEEHGASSEASEPLRIQQLAEQLGYNSTHCNHVFHKS